MDGRCFVCASKFTLFCREQCCGLCKRSICGKCTVETKKSTITVKACLECKKIQENEYEPSILDPPKFLQKLEDLPGPSTKRTLLKRHITDDDIQARLNALKNHKPTTKPVRRQSTQLELQSKLNKMIGRPPPVQEPVIQLFVNVKPMTQQADELVTQVDNECKLDNNTQSNTTGLEELEKRAKALKYETSKLLATHCKGKVSQDDDIRDLSYMSEEEQVEYLIKMTQEETLLDEKAGIERVSPEPADKDKDIADDADDEVPWCCVCTNDAEVRCAECDNDLYCKRCFREGHDEFDLEDHQPAIFKQVGKRCKTLE